MTSTCPAGHTSDSADYCDVCGMPIDTSEVSAAPTAPPPTDTPSQAAGAQLCPNCSTPNAAEALFCENCGYDFTTGTMPRSASAAPVAEEASELTPTPLTTPDAPAADAARTTEHPVQISAPLKFGWVAEVWIDPAWYEAQESPDAMPSPGLPSVVPLRNKSILVGRKSRSRNIHPDIDCEPDTGTSRRQAQLTTDGTRWWVEDLESSNGTFVGAASDPLPEDPIPVGPKRELKPDDRIYVGAWTRLVIREATEEELTSLG
jgi:hypothetical protein